MKKIGFISTRFSGTDGVTLEAGKWAEVLRQHNHDVYWFAGELDREPENSYLVPEAHFKSEPIESLNRQIFGAKRRDLETTQNISRMKDFLKNHLRLFIEKFSIDILIAQNVLTIPLHIPLGIALTETIAETQIPTIAHHHDFYWERTRFIINAVGDYLRMAFPPNLNGMKHVVINSSAQEELALRTGIASIIIPNVLDFEHPPAINQARTSKLRESIGLSSDDVIILQPTRIIQRKGIEHAIEFVKKLGNPKYKLFISHEAGDEGFEYQDWIQENALNQGVDLRLINARIEDPWNNRQPAEGRFSLWDIYPHADFITFPSLYEGFGNAFLEAIYFKKPILINRYATFVRDIEPLGFDLIVMDQYLTSKNIQKARDVLECEDRRSLMVEKNYQIATRHYSYSVLWNNLNYMLAQYFGVQI
ncbi:MAG: glycosyltransferase family 4 protein [Pseudomonadota bacterium]